MEIGGEFFTSQGPPKPEQIIEISGFQRVRQRLEINIERKKGNIILIIGTRGIGKSTALEYFKDYSNNVLKYDCSRFLDIGLHIPKLLDKDYNERVPYILKKIALVLSNNKEDDISKVIETLDKYEKGPFFLFIDNLDRLYQNKDDLGFVKYFFQTADPTLKALSKKVVIVISCAPEWNIFLEERDLSYMNFSNSITLEPLSVDEIKKLIESRANSDGFKIEEIIETNLLPILQVASRGNPRSVFQFLEKVMDEIDYSELPIDIPTFQKVVGSELFNGAIEKLREIASGSPQMCWGISQLWRYFDALQKSGIDYRTGIEKLIKAHANNFIDDSEIKIIKKAWSRVSYSNKSNKWVLNPQVRDMLTEWYRKTKIDKEILLTAYSENPFTVSTTDVEDYIDEYQDCIVYIESASSVFSKSLEEYMSINSIDIKEDRIKLINSGWNCVKDLMLTIIAIEEGDVPVDLALRLNDKKTLEEAANELIISVGEIYKESHKVNPFRSELHSIKDRLLDVNDNPEVVKYWDSEQIRIFKSQILSSYEGLLRGLKPSNLETSEKRKNSKKISSIIRKGESNHIEFKSSLRWDYRNENINKELKIPVLKTISAFLNTYGGKLIIGVNDDGTPIGIEKEILTLKKKDVDGYEQHIMELIDKNIGSDISVYIKTCFTRFKGYKIALISVEKSPYAVYLKSNSENEFYIRTGNTTRKLDGERMNKYINTHWTY